MKFKLGANFKRFRPPIKSFFSIFLTGLKMGTHSLLFWNLSTHDLSIAKRKKSRKIDNCKLFRVS